MKAGRFVTTLCRQCVHFARPGYVVRHLGIRWMIAAIKQETWRTVLPGLLPVFFYHICNQFNLLTGIIYRRSGIFLCLSCWKHKFLTEVCFGICGQNMGQLATLNEGKKSRKVKWLTTKSAPHVEWDRIRGIFWRGFVTLPHGNRHLAHLTPAETPRTSTQQTHWEF
jgi:hypothetical protein